MERRAVERLLTAASLPLLVPAAIHVWRFGAVLRDRIRFPLDLEWVEGGHIYHAFRILHRLPIYADPRLGFAPYPYPPLFWVVIAAASRLGGLDYPVGRAVSIASAAAIAAIFGWRLVRRAPSPAIGVAFAFVGVASFDAGYGITGGGIDLARPDSFATFLAVAAAAVVGDGKLTNRRAVLVAGLFVAGLFAKQTGVFFAAWLLGFVFVRDRRRGLVVAGVSSLGALFGFLVMSAATGGWFAVWLFEMGRHPLLLRTAADPLFELLRHAPFLPVVLLAAGWAHRRRRLEPETINWLGLFGAATVSALVAHVKEGGWMNLYVQLVLLAWPVSLLVVVDVLRSFRPDEALRRRVTTAATLSVAALALLHANEDRTLYVPTPERWRSARDLRALVAGLDGDAVVPAFPFVGALAGKTCSQPSVQAYSDLRKSGMAADLAGALAATRPRWIITSGLPIEEPLEAELEPSYERVRQLDLVLYPDGIAKPPTLWRRR